MNRESVQVMKESFSKGLLSLLLAAAAAVAMAVMLTPEPALAQEHSARRQFSSAWVKPGGELTVTVTATNYGALGLVVETLPEGFRYAGSELSEAAVEVHGRTISVVLIGESRVTYRVTAPSEEGRYEFSGVIKNVSREERALGGSRSVRVGPPPTSVPTRMPTHTPTPEPTPTPTPTPEPTATPAPEPAATPTPEPTATPTPTPPTRGGSCYDGSADSHADP